jgi:two-component system, NarL family, nitrate/nitrite response regulator NarL
MLGNASPGVGGFGVGLMYGSAQLSAERIRVGIAEATRMSSHLVASELKRRGNNFEVFACCGNSSGAFQELSDYKPDVAVISAALEDGPLTGFKVLHQLRTSQPKLPAIILLNSDDRELVIDAFRAGARGIFCRGQSSAALPKCIRTVYYGQIWVNNNELEFLLDLISNLKPIQIASPRAMALLTRRELDVMRFVAEGMRNHEISVKLKLSEHTVRNYIFRMYEKLGLSSRVELALYSLSQSETNQGSTPGPQ